MAHEIWNNNMAYLNADGKPWHGLGKPLTGNESIDECLQIAGRAILAEIVDSPGANLPSAKGTWWGVLNGVTHYYDHDSPTRIANSDNRTNARQDNRLTSAWYGVNAKKKEQALDLAMQYATERTN
jgi:hypothetical protein